MLVDTAAASLDHTFIHSYRSLSYDRPIALSKASSPHSAI